VCGIVGMMETAPGGGRVCEATLVAMRETLRHRGPDAAGTWLSSDGRVGLGHRRLAILDLSAAANQPFVGDDGALALVFNGEIYNHAALRAELDAAGPVRWRTAHSDTEVLLRAWERWGVASLPRLRGMFAFAVWDSRARALWLVRDRLGIKPLYYARGDRRLAFASEVKALLADPRQTRAVDEDALLFYLSHLSSPPAQTLLAGVAKVPAATWVRIGADGAIRSARYWDPWDHATPLVGVPVSEIAERIVTTLDEAVDLRRRADVPVGTFLSGGLDSSAVSALIARRQAAPIRTFTVAFAAPGETRGDLHYARVLAAHVGAEHHEIVLRPDDVVAALPAVLASRDEPLGHGVELATLAVARLAREHGRVVMLSGEGADELYGGYAEWRRMAALEGIARRTGPRWIKEVARRLLTAGGRGDGWRAEYLARAARGEPLFQGGAEGWPPRQQRHLLSPRLREHARRHPPWALLAPIHDHFRRKAWEPSPLHWMTHLSLHVRLPELILRRLDWGTMAVSQEARVPFLDHRCVELALGVPTRTKLHGRTLKPLLQRSFRRLLPPAILGREKRGFPPVPVAPAFAGRVATLAAPVVDQLCRESDLLDAAAVRAVMARRSRAMWPLVALAFWWRAHRLG